MNEFQEWVRLIKHKLIIQAVTKLICRHSNLQEQIQEISHFQTKITKNKKIIVNLDKFSMVAKNHKQDLIKV